MLDHVWRSGACTWSGVGCKVSGRPEQRRDVVLGFEARKSDETAGNFVGIAFARVAGLG